MVASAHDEHDATVFAGAEEDVADPGWAVDEVHQQPVRPLDCDQLHRMADHCFAQTADPGRVSEIGRLGSPASGSTARRAM